MLKYLRKETFHHTVSNHVEREKIYFLFKNKFPLLKFLFFKFVKNLFKSQKLFHKLCYKWSYNLYNIRTTTLIIKKRGKRRYIFFSSYSFFKFACLWSLNYLNKCIFQHVLFNDIKLLLRIFNIKYPFLGVKITAIFLPFLFKIPFLYLYLSLFYFFVFKTLLYLLCLL